MLTLEFTRRVHIPRSKCLIDDFRQTISMHFFMKTSECAMSCNFFVLYIQDQNVSYDKTPPSPRPRLLCQPLESLAWETSRLNYWKKIKEILGTRYSWGTKWKNKEFRGRVVGFQSFSYSLFIKFVPQYDTIKVYVEWVPSEKVYVN